MEKKKNLNLTKKKRKSKKSTSKNNKGFTLIEIIAAVIILGILVVISSTAVVEYIEDSKVKTYESYKKDLKGSSENLFIDCVSNNDNDCNIPSYGNDVVLRYDELVDKGYSDVLKDPEGDGYCDQSYVIASNKSENGIDLEYQVCLFCSNYESKEKGCKRIDSSDTTSPSCGDIKGESKVWTKENRVISVGCSDIGTGCRKPEFSKSFGEEGKVITVANLVVEDNAGNLRTCPVDVYVDKKAPTCKIEIETESAIGWYQHGIKAVIKNIKDEGSGVVASGMGTSLMNRDYNGKTSYTVTGGIVTVFGYVKDRVGNEGYCSKEVKVDNTDPTATLYMGYEVYPKENSTIESNYLNISNLSKYGEIEGVIVYFDSKLTSNVANNVFDGNDNSIKTSGGITAGDNRGIIRITPDTYDRLKLYLGNTSYLRKITKVEVIKKENITSVWTNKDVSVYVEAYDTITGVGGYSFDNGTNYQTSNIRSYSANTSGTVKVKDQAGNVSSNYLFIINKIDKVVPTCTLTSSGTKGDDNWYTSNVSINFATHTDDTSGVNSYGIGSITGAKETTQTTDTTGITFTGHIEDNAGNTNTCTTTVKKDATNPSCSLTSSGTKGDNDWYTSDVSISFATHTDGTSGVNSYGLNSVTGNTTATLSTDTIGTTYTGHIKDEAGNTNTCTTTVKRDTVEPSCSLTSSGTKGDNDWYTSDVSISFATHTDGTSGVNSYGLNSVTGNKTATLSTDTTSTTYTGHIKDEAGNTNTCTTTVKRDTVEPSCSLTSSGTEGENGWYKSNVSISFATHTDGTSGVNSYGIGSTTGSKETTQTTDTTGITFTGHIKDNAGNTNTCITTVKKDTKAPELKSVTIGYNGEALTSNNSFDVKMYEQYTASNKLKFNYRYCYVDKYSGCPTDPITKFSDVGNSGNDFIRSDLGNYLTLFNTAYGNNSEKHTVYYLTKVCDEASNCTCHYFTINWEANSHDAPKEFTTPLGTNKNGGYSYTAKTITCN